MVKLTKLIKAIIGIALFNRAIRNTLIAMLMSPINRIFYGRPSTSSIRDNNQPNDLQALLESILASILLKSTKDGGIKQENATSTIGALLVNLMRSMEGHSDSRDRIIESKDYTILSEK